MEIIWYILILTRSCVPQNRRQKYQPWKTKGELSVHDRNFFVSQHKPSSSSSFLCSLPVQEEGVEPTKNRSTSHAPHKHLHREWHDCSHLVWEGGSKHRCEKPNCHLEVFTAWRLWRCTLVPTQTVEERDKVCIWEAHKGDGSQVSIWLVYRHARVESQEDEANYREQWGTMVFGLLRHWPVPRTIEKGFIDMLQLVWTHTNGESEEILVVVVMELAKVDTSKGRSDCRLPMTVGSWAKSETQKFVWVSTMYDDLACKLVCLESACSQWWKMNRITNGGGYHFLP